MSNALSVVDTVILALIGVHNVSTRKALSKQIGRVSNKLVLQWHQHRILSRNPDSTPGKNDG